MTKLAVTIVLAVLVIGSCIYAYGHQIVPAIGSAGTSTKTQIDAAFQ